MAVFMALSIIVSLAGLASQYAIMGEVTVGAVIGVTIFSILSTSLPLLGVLIGLYLYWRRTTHLKQYFDKIGYRGLTFVSSGLLLLILSFIFYLFAIFMPWQITVYIIGCALLATILQLIGFIVLSKSKTLNIKGRRGARQLYSATICFILSPICLIVPVIGATIWLLLSVAFFWLQIKGWGKISSSFSKGELRKRAEQQETDPINNEE